LIFGYALLGATWLVMKTEGVTQEWARKYASYVLACVGLFLVIVSISMPMMNKEVHALWFSLPNFFYLLPMPVATAVLFFFIWRGLHGTSEYRPFFFSLLVFLMGYIGLVVSLWPWLVPFSVTFRQAAAAGPSQSLLLVGTAVMLPVVLTYTAFCYYLFRGKASHEGVY
jgi:cytochrome d ubiquinol oxidase subunit II